VGPKRIITIDGPAGAGKSTVGRRLAQSLGYLYLDSGALYRAVALKARQADLDLGDPEALGGFLAGFHPEVRADARGFHLLVEGVEVTDEIRSAAAGRDASRVAVLPVVRRWVKERLRYLARNGGVVAEGRDQGTAVFPEARWKFYLDAALATRAARRRGDWQRDGEPPELEAIMADLASRDRQDETRQEAPLTVPEDAIVMDTTELNIEEVVEQCLATMRGRLDHKPSHS
jgi:cytidylate kinase